jgi:tRNA threonylcarbamoyladenosine biosynthesis protein TsaE
MEWIVTEESMLPQVARAFLDHLDGRKVVAFYGEIGAGKTTFIKAICQQLGVDALEVSSPTFALVNEYSYHDSVTKHQNRIFHLDLYRLETLEEALDMGIEDYLAGEAFCFIEWPALIEPILPDDIIRIKLEATDEFTRRLIVE